MCHDDRCPALHRLAKKVDCVVLAVEGDQDTGAIPEMVGVGGRTLLVPAQHRVRCRSVAHVRRGDTQFHVSLVDIRIVRIILLQQGIPRAQSPREKRRLW